MANRKNYSKISTEGVKAKPTEEIKVESTLEPVEPEANEKVENKSVPKIRKGVVDNCERLNVRTNPSTTASIDTVIEKGTEVEITDSSGDFYFVRKGPTTEGFNGWCMKKFISVNE